MHGSSGLQTQAWPPHLRNLVASELCNGAAHALHTMVAVSKEALRCQSCQLCRRRLPLHIQGQAVHLSSRLVALSTACTACAMWTCLLFVQLMCAAQAVRRRCCS